MLKLETLSTDARSKVSPIMLALMVYLDSLFVAWHDMIWYDMIGHGCSDKPFDEPNAGRPQWRSNVPGLEPLLPEIDHLRREWADYCMESTQW